jgi:predicted esterase
VKRYLIALLALTELSLGSAPLTNTPTALGTFDLQFQVSPPYSTSGEIKRRLSAAATTTAYTLSKEKFHVIVPDTYTNDLSCGVLVWISPGPKPSIPHDWPEILAKHKLLFVSPYNADNNRGAIERCRLALDASYNMRLRYRISPKRIYVSGFSGGGRVASLLGVAYSDVFTGTIPICGVNFYMTISAGGDQVWNPGYKTQPALLNTAKTNGRFVLITGDNDVNLHNTSAIYEQGFKQFGFEHVLYLQVPGMGHAIPSAEYLNRALDYVDTLKAVSATPRK